MCPVLAFVNTGIKLLFPHKTGNFVLAEQMLEFQGRDTYEWFSRFICTKLCQVIVIAVVYKVSKAIENKGLFTYIF